MDRPTAAELRADETINAFLVGNGFPVADPDTKLSDEITLAWAYVESRTCRDLDTLDPVTNETLAVIAKRAVILRLFQQAVILSADFTGDASDDRIKSFSVPGYSETRRDGPTDMKSSWMLNPLPSLHDLLRELITDTCWDEWIAQSQGDVLPASTMLEVDWFRLPYTNPPS